MTHAQSIDDYFVSIPDTLLPYVSSDNREELLRFADSEKDTCSIIDNKMGNKSWLSRKTKEQIVFHPTESCVWEMMLLPTEADSLLCLIKTFKGPEEESVIYIFNKEWEYVKTVTVEDRVQTIRPDSMSIAEYDELMNYLENSMIVATIDKEVAYTINVSYSMPLLSNEEKKKVQPIIVQTKLKWNGKTFN